MNLTGEQKAANRDARKARDRAYQARRKVYETALEAALAPYPYGSTDTPVAPVTQAAREATKAFDAAVEAARIEEQGIHAQIAKLEESLKYTRERYGIPQLRETRDAAGEALRSARASAEKEVRARFPDIVGVYSAAEWVTRKEAQS